MTNKIKIIGAGLAGLSAAYHLKGNYDIYEQDSKVGGLCKSEVINGFIFDYAVHILYTKNDYVSNLIKTKLLINNFREIVRKSYVYYNSKYTEYPFQVNLFGHDPDVIKECILGLIYSTYKSENKPQNFREWILSTFGTGIANHFMLPYNKKVWAADTAEMDFDWVSERIPRPSLEDVIDGALKPPNKRYGPNSFFWYPSRGGIGSLPNGFLPFIKNLNLNTEVTSVSVKNKRMVIKNSKGNLIRSDYRNIISTLPLPKLVSLMEDAPETILKLAKDLQYNKVYAINIGLKIPFKDLDKHWIYFPEEKYIFQRISLPSNFSPNMAPKNKSSITAEVSVQRDKEVNIEKLVDRTIYDLIACGILADVNDVLFSKAFVLNPAYVIPSKDRHKVDTLKDHLFTNGIYSCGRFGDWAYLNMDQAILSGKQAAELLLKESTDAQNV